MSQYARWGANLGRVYGAMILLFVTAAIVFRTWAPIKGLGGLLSEAALVYGIGTPIMLSAERRRRD